MLAKLLGELPECAQDVIEEKIRNEFQLFWNKSDI
jgi:hypothetical protein